MEVQRASCIVALNPDSGDPLTASRRGEPNQVGAIGGKGEPGESDLDCAYREFFEETGEKLEHEPVLIMQGIDNTGVFNSVYLVAHPSDIKKIYKAYNGVVKEIELGIFVSFSAWPKLLSGPFGAFNSELIPKLIGYLANSLLNNERAPE